MTLLTKSSGIRAAILIFFKSGKGAERGLRLHFDSDNRLGQVVEQLAYRTDLEQYGGQVFVCPPRRGPFWKACV